jgi:hypothetical protein
MTNPFSDMPIGEAINDNEIENAEAAIAELGKLVEELEDACNDAGQADVIS